MNSTDFIDPGFIALIAVLVLIIIAVMMAVKTVPQGFEYTVERFGKYSRTLKPGLSVIFPFLDAIGRRMNMRESVMDIPTQEVITRDNAMVAVDGVVFYQVMNAADAAYQVNDLERAMENLALTNIRTVMGSMELDELLSQRDRINAELLTVIDDATNPWGTKVTRVEIRDITPPRAKSTSKTTYFIHRGSFSSVSPAPSSRPRRSYSTCCSIATVRLCPNGPRV